MNKEDFTSLVTEMERFKGYRECYSHHERVEEYQKAILEQLIELTELTRVVGVNLIKASV